MNHLVNDLVDHPARYPVNPTGDADETDDLCFRTAYDLSVALARREVSAREVVTAHLERIERVNPAVNAIVTLVADRALEQAAEADERMAAGEPVGPLHGLPVAHKDLHDTAGIRTTSGSPIFADRVPDRDHLVVERLRRAGAITLGKTNVPELGPGFAHRQPRLRRHPQPVRPVPQRGRQQRRGGGRPRLRHAARSPTAATPAARCATPPPSTTSSGCAPPRAGCRPGPTRRRGASCR